MISFNLKQLRECARANRCDDMFVQESLNIINALSIPRDFLYDQSCFENYLISSYSSFFFRISLTEWFSVCCNGQGNEHDKFTNDSRYHLHEHYRIFRCSSLGRTRNRSTWLLVFIVMSRTSGQPDNNVIYPSTSANHSCWKGKGKIRNLSPEVKAEGA